MQNIILNVWCLFIALCGTVLIDRLGRKNIALIATVLSTVFLFVVGALTKVYGTSTNTSGIYGTVASIFLFQGTDVTSKLQISQLSRRADQFRPQEPTASAGRPSRFSTRPKCSTTRSDLQAWACTPSLPTPSGKHKPHPSQHKDTSHG